MQSIELREIALELEIQAPVDLVWRTMIEDISEWWPKDFLCIREAEKVRLEPWAGGRLYEEAPDGRQILWAHVALILPGQAVEFVGMVTPTYGGPNMSTYRLEVNATTDQASKFKLTNSILGRSNPEGEAETIEGWNYLCGQFKEYAERKMTIQ